jgi:protein SCO1/2
MIPIPRSRLRAAASVLAAAVVCATAPLARAETTATPPVGAPGRAEAEVRLADALLVDQDGVAARFRSDVIGDGVVVVDFVFTTCTTVCPVLSSVFARVQHRLGDRLGHGVTLVSVSLDPVRDNPARLKAYAAKHGAGPHWRWLTGKQEDVEQVLKGLGAYTPNFSAHVPMVLVGDARSGRWTRLNGFPAVDRIVAKVEELLAAPTRTASAAR